MDSIELLEAAAKNHGKECKVEVSNGDLYRGVINGLSESTPDNKPALRLRISEAEATRIGVSYLREIAIPYDVIKGIEF